MIATTCGSFLTVPFVLAKAGHFAFAGAPESGHITLNTDKAGTGSLRSRPGACPARHRRSRQHLPVSVTGAETEIDTPPGVRFQIPKWYSSPPYRPPARRPKKTRGNRKHLFQAIYRLREREMLRG